MSRRGGADERTPLLCFPLSGKQLGGTAEIFWVEERE
jgi:hypothetical protein